jgi:hypothetical protein
VRVVEAVKPLNDAEIVVFELVTTVWPVAKPLELIVATAVLLEFQVVEVVTSLVVLSE